MQTINEVILFKATPHVVFELLMNEEKHAKLTDSKSKISKKVDGSFSIYNGSLFGKTLELKKDKKIVQLWQCKMQGWPHDHFSKVTFEFEKTAKGTKMIFTQENIPDKCYESIKAGWHEYYWNPIKNMLK
ncbi:hypothetical protein C4573_02895 [Candidatus Woesearchaeota archaeon]|nr:MAG: hypothetical protein C4573_02895 [Candidatus Woesearchaeota archaeon]